MLPNLENTYKAFVLTTRMVFVVKSQNITIVLKELKSTCSFPYVITYFAHILYFFSYKKFIHIRKTDNPSIKIKFETIHNYKYYIRQRSIIFI